MERVKNHQNFRFCAIPQVMAVGTLALCYNNPRVFTGKLLTDRVNVWAVYDIKNTCMHSKHIYACLPK